MKSNLADPPIVLSTRLPLSIRIKLESYAAKNSMSLAQAVKEAVLLLVDYEKTDGDS